MLRAHRLFQYIVLMSYILFWMLGFGTLWVGLKLFDDEVILIATLLVGSGLVLTGLFSLPAKLQFVVEVALIASLFHICIECIEHRAIAGSCRRLRLAALSPNISPCWRLRHRDRL